MEAVLNGGSGAELLGVAPTIRIDTIRERLAQLQKRNATSTVTPTTATVPNLSATGPSPAEEASDPTRTSSASTAPNSNPPAVEVAAAASPHPATPVRPPDSFFLPSRELKYRRAPAPRCSASQFVSSLIGSRKRGREECGNPPTAEPCCSIASGRSVLAPPYTQLSDGESRSVEDYEKIGRISEGVYGVVYKARHNVTQELRAVKFIRTRWWRESEIGIPVYLLREFDIILRLRHPNLVEGLDLTLGKSEDGQMMVFVVMAYAGIDLKTYLYRSMAPFSIKALHRITDAAARSAATTCLIRRAKCVLWQMLQGIHYIHANHILHRDLKNSNILVDEKDGTVRICDFGLARVYRDGNPLTTNVVTLAYRAPELHFALSDYSTAVDIWSLGCIFGEFLRHRPMFPCTEELIHLQALCDILGFPTEDSFEGLFHVERAVTMLKSLKQYNMQGSKLRELFPAEILSDAGFDLLSRMLAWNPKCRVTAEEALSHPYFQEEPVACTPSQLLEKCDFSGSVVEESQVGPTAAQDIAKTIGEEVKLAAVPTVAGQEAQEDNSLTPSGSTAQLVAGGRDDRKEQDEQQRMRARLHQHDEDEKDEASLAPATAESSQAKPDSE